MGRVHGDCHGDLHVHGNRRGGLGSVAPVILLCWPGDAASRGGGRGPCDRPPLPTSGAAVGRGEEVVAGEEAAPGPRVAEADAGVALSRRETAVGWLGRDGAAPPSSSPSDVNSLSIEQASAVGRRPRRPTRVLVRTSPRHQLYLFGSHAHMPANPLHTHVLINSERSRPFAFLEVRQ